jgi:hypothetical protein
MRFLLFLFLGFSATYCAFGQDRMIVSRLSEEIVFDGDNDEIAWSNIEALPVIMFSPDYGNAPSEYTEMKLAYDDNYLYYSGRMHDKNADKWKIQLKRDDWKWNCDWAILVLDTYNDKENTIIFATSPSGGRTDVAFSNDVNDLSTDMNLSWNTYWDVKTRLDDEGWNFEMRIPFSSLRFQEVDGKVIMGITTLRYISNTYETFVFPRVDVKHGFWGIYKASQTQESEFSGIKSKNPIYISPYVLGGFAQTNSLNEVGTEYVRSTDFARNVGGDIKYRVSDKFTVDMTINTDFAQVEADNQMVNLTRFSLFFPEKRLFFQERRSNFEFNFDEQNRLFYTRKIGISKGMPTDIYGGARVVGRVGPWDIGVLSMQTAPTEDLNSENFAVLRFRRQILNENTYVGGILTNRIDFKGNYNTTYGADGIFKLFKDDFLKLMFAQSFTNDYKNKAISFDPSRIYVNWERRTLKGFGYNLKYSRAGVDYNPGIGYERRSDYSQYYVSLFHGWVPEKKFIYSHKISVDAVQYTRNMDGSRETAEGWLGWEFLSSSGAEASFTQKYIVDNLDTDFYLSDNEYVPAGSYSFTNLTANLSSAKGKQFILASELNVGPFYDGWVNSIGISPTATLFKQFEISGTYQYNTAKFKERDMEFQAHIFRLNSTLVFNTKLSFSAFVQYNSGINAVLANGRLRYNPKEGIDLYLVYNEGYNTDRYLYNPTLPLSNQRTFMLKYTYTFIL